MHPKPRPGLVVLIPVYNDGPACVQMLELLDEALSQAGLTASVLIVDDGSDSDLICTSCCKAAYHSLDSINLLRLRRNVGHQRAICIGLSYLEATSQCDAVAVMDGDGEDDPRDVPRLVKEFEVQSRAKIVFAERTKRCESLTFRVFYIFFRILHRVLTGSSVRVGNFSVIPRLRLRSLVVVPELWSHYASAVFTSRQPYCSVPTQRAPRLDGSSKMNFVSLVTHGLTAIASFSETVGTRLLVLSFTLAMLATTGIVTVVLIRLLTELAIPGWATYTFGLLSVLFTQAVLAMIAFSFIILRSRSGAVFIPARDYDYYIDRTTKLR